MHFSHPLKQSMPFLLCVKIIKNNSNNKTQTKTHGLPLRRTYKIIGKRYTKKWCYNLQFSSFVYFSNFFNIFKCFISIILCNFYNSMSNYYLCAFYTKVKHGTIFIRSQPISVMIRISTQEKFNTVIHLKLFFLSSRSLNLTWTSMHIQKVCFNLDFENQHNLYSSVTRMFKGTLYKGLPPFLRITCSRIIKGHPWYFWARMSVQIDHSTYNPATIIQFPTQNISTIP